MIYASGLDGVWAVAVTERTFRDDLVEESRELMGLYGALVHGIGHLLLSDGVSLPPKLAEWSTAPSVPLAQLGLWEPSLVSIDGASQLALTRDFDNARVFMTTHVDQHVIALSPSSELTAVLSHRDDLHAPAAGWDQHGP